VAIRGSLNLAAHYQNDLSRLLVDISDDVDDDGPEEALASTHGAGCVPCGFEIVGKPRRSRVARAVTKLRIIGFIKTAIGVAGRDAIGSVASSRRSSVSDRRSASWG
jgi:hypothetical protein